MWLVVKSMMGVPPYLLFVNQICLHPGIDVEFGIQTQLFLPQTPTRYPLSNRVDIVTHLSDGHGF